MTIWQVEVKRNDQVVVLVCADRLGKCASFLIGYLLERAGIRKP